MHATLNIIKRYAQGQIASQMSVREQEGEEKLHTIYARRVVMPGIAYLGADGFIDEFHGSHLVNGMVREALSKCIYVGPRGSSEEVRRNSIRQGGLCTCREMMRYARGFRLVEVES